jgi:hypothetical protein
VARCDDREAREYFRDEQRSQTGGEAMVPARPIAVDRAARTIVEAVGDAAARVWRQARPPSRVAPKISREMLSVGLHERPERSSGHGCQA